MFDLMHVHYSWLGMTSCFISGLLFGWARRPSGTVTLPIILHAATNVFAMRRIALSVS
jgi:membrane protease YdiL (CAAX protease family)